MDVKYKLTIKLRQFQEVIYYFTGGLDKCEVKCVFNFIVC